MTHETPDAFVAALCSAGPALPAHAQIFAPFIGSWDLTVDWYDAAGTISRSEAGEWHFASVLEGRGVQDVWIVPPRHARGSATLYEYGTSIRFYDPALGAWQSTWIGPMHGVVRTFLARKIGETVVLETTADVTPPMRWTFSDIAADSFRWTNEVRDGDRWRVQQTFAARRADSSAAAGPA